MGSLRKRRSVKIVPDLCDGPVRDVKLGCLNGL